MTPEQYPDLKTELTTDPLSLGYAADVTTKNYTNLANKLNTPLGIIPISRLCNERTILSYYPDGPLAADGVLCALETYAASTGIFASITARGLRYVKQPDGLDLGSATTAQLLGALVQANVITQAQMKKLISIATTSRGMDLFNGEVCPNDVAAALKVD